MLPTTCHRLLPFAALAGTLLDACSQGPSDTAAGPTRATTAAPAKRPTATRADSLNGMPGHRFGEPLSAFAGLQPLSNQEPGYEWYHYPDGKGDKSWFGKHLKEVPSVKYLFYGGKFAAFQAIAYGPHRNELHAEATYLFGPGVPFGEEVRWQGQQVSVISSQSIVANQPAEILDVVSLPLRAQMKRDVADRMKAENEGASR